MTGVGRALWRNLRGRLGPTLAAARPHWPLGAVLVVLLVAALLTGARVSLLEGAEEAPFVAQALERQGHADEPPYVELVAQFAHHPAVDESPAYRWLSQGAVALCAGHDASAAPIRPNPYLSAYDPAGGANRNTLLHPLAAVGVARAVRLLRVFSLLAMLGATAAAYAIALWLTGDRSAATLTAVATGLLPAAVIAASTANADALTALTVVVILVIAVRLWERPASSGWVLASMAAPALGMLVSPAARTISPLPLLVMAVTVLHTHDGRVRRHRALLTAAGLGLYLIVRALCALAVAEADPLVLQAAEVIVGLRSSRPALILTRFTQALWGVLGWRSVPLDRVAYTALNALTIVSAGGLALAALRRWWSPPATVARHGWWVVVALVLALAGRYLLLLWRDGGLLAESLAGLIAPVGLLLAAGWCAWLPQRGQWLMSVALAVLMFVAALALPATTQRSAPPELDLTYLADENVTPVGIEYGNDLYLVGYSVDRDTVARGEAVTVRLVWLARRRPAVDYTVSVEVTGRQRMQVGIANSMPGGGTSPTSDWIPGQIIQDEIAVPISPLAHTPTKGDIRVTVYRGIKEDPLTARAPDGAELGISPRIGAIRLVSPYETRYEPAAPMQVDWGESVRLLGFGVNPVQPRLGAPWTIDLYWQALQPVRVDYTVFVHLVNAYGRILAQTDEQPLQGDYPTSLWREGEHVADRHVIAVPERMDGGPFYLLIGLYDAATGERLVYSSPEGLSSDHLTFGPLLPSPR